MKYVTYSVCGFFPDSYVYIIKEKRKMVSHQYEILKRLNKRC